MVDDADRALYLAKNSGKDRIETWESEKKSEPIPAFRPSVILNVPKKSKPRDFAVDPLAC